MESALGFARDGFPAYQLLHRTIGSPDRLADLESTRTRRGSICPTASPALGSLFTQPDLARTLTLMVEAEQRALGRASHAAALQTARDVFYKGDVARRMVQALHDLGGLYTYEDFAEYTSPLEEPLSTTYRGYELFTNRTWTQGITLLQTLNILEGYDLAAMGHNSPQAIHVQVEALKLALPTGSVRGDPAHVDVPVEGLLSRSMRPCGAVSSIPTRLRRYIHRAILARC